LGEFYGSALPYLINDEQHINRLLALLMLPLALNNGKSPSIAVMEFMTLFNCFLTEPSAQTMHRGITQFLSNFTGGALLQLNAYQMPLNPYMQMQPMFVPQQQMQQQQVQQYNQSTVNTPYHSSANQDHQQYPYRGRGRGKGKY